MRDLSDLSLYGMTEFNFSSVFHLFNEIPNWEKIDCRLIHDETIHTKVDIWKNTRKLSKHTSTRIYPDGNHCGEQCTDRCWNIMIYSSPSSLTGRLSAYIFDRDISKLDEGDSIFQLKFSFSDSRIKMSKNIQMMKFSMIVAIMTL